MASCDDDFDLLGDDTQSHHHHHHHHHHHPSSFVPSSVHRFAPNKSTAAPLHSNHPLNSLGSPKKIATSNDAEDADDYTDAAAFCSQSDAKCPSSFHEVNPFVTAPDDTNPFATETVGVEEDEDDPKSRIRPDKRKERDDLSDGSTPYCFKKSRPGERSGGDCRKEREEWSDSAIGSLLDAYTEKYLQLNRGNLRGRDWEEVASVVSERCDKQKNGKSVEQCKNKLDNLKKRYKVELHRMSTNGLSSSHWHWFKKMEQIVGPAKAASDDDKSAGVSVPLPSQQSKRYPVIPLSPVTLSTNPKTKTLSHPRWRRVVFKISGATLSGNGPQNVDPKVTLFIAREVAVANRLGVEVAIVVGGQNFFCGDTWATTAGLDRTTSYQIRMMATVMNSMLLQASLEKLGIQTRVQTSFSMQEFAEPYIKRRAIRHLEKGRVVIFGGFGSGAGNSLFTTDTAAALRASEINAEAVLKGTSVDRIYDCQSRNSTNITYEHITFREFISRGGISSMDLTALTFCEENGIPVAVFNLLEPSNISRALCGEQVGILIDQSGRNS